MKANHNLFHKALLCPFVVVNISKIQNESKSQQIFLGHMFHNCCCQYFKDTK